MDEVDNIIIHSLRQIGCKIDEDIRSLSSFTPELLVDTVSKCLQLIKPSLVLPKSLPPGMAQRFSVTASLAEACALAGFQGDIGYQTFLYSNVTEVRRVFMFLIERLPKETEKHPLTQPLDKLMTLENEISRNIHVQLNSPWIPQYCCKSGIRAYDSNTLGVIAESTKFQPQLNLNIPSITMDVQPEIRDYWKKRSPSFFQQTNSQTIYSTIIHKNDMDKYLTVDSKTVDNWIKAIISKSNNDLPSSNNLVNNSNNSLLADGVGKVANALNSISSSSSSSTSNANISKVGASKTQNTQQVNKIKSNPIEEQEVQIEKLKNTIDELLSKRKAIQSEIVQFKEQKVQHEEVLTKIRDERKVKERIGILCENSEVNISKMETLIASTQDRMVKLKEQWQEHRKPLVEALEKSKAKSSNKVMQNKEVMDQIKIIREKSIEKTEDLKHKTILYTQLVNELQKVDKTISRNAYTSRILEIVGNIRKQKTDIDKVLRDTRDLQKEISNITGQLDRQFTVTDDLLYKTAKRDEHSKKAYKLLATLHSDCSDLVTLVQETGAVMREVRDLEDQIENEKARNISTNLEKITLDLKHMEKDSKDLQEKIRKVENQITQG